LEDLHMSSRRFVPLVLALSLGLAFGGSAASVGAAASNKGTTGSTTVHKNCNNSIKNANVCAPEAPVPIGLPLTGLAVVGGYIWLVRRRDAAGRAWLAVRIRD
jgi:hypothetical protein